MTNEPSLGAKRVIDGQLRVYFHGYWIKAYDIPADTLDAKKRLIQALTRRLFNHVEHGLNVPGVRLEEARLAFETETDPERKRVKAGMLAGALFNRAADVFTKLVELQSLGVVIQHDNALMRQCGAHLQEALSLGKMVRHRSGEEGIDELWGEPFKAFAFPVEDFYTSRYIKIAQTMRAIDQITGEVSCTFAPLRSFSGLEPLLTDFAGAAKAKCETLRTDADIFDVWTSFTVSGERLLTFRPSVPPTASLGEQERIRQGVELIAAATDLIRYVTRARVPMPKSTREFIERLEHYRSSFGPLITPTTLSVA